MASSFCLQAPPGSPPDPRISELDQLRRILEHERAERRQMLAGLAPFVQKFEEYERKIYEYQQMEPALRGRIATLEAMLLQQEEEDGGGGGGGYDNFTTTMHQQCEQCDSFGEMCEQCDGDETVCTGCCRYQMVHGYKTIVC